MLITSDWSSLFTPFAEEPKIPPATIVLFVVLSISICPPKWLSFIVDALEVETETAPLTLFIAPTSPPAITWLVFLIWIKPLNTTLLIVSWVPETSLPKELSPTSPPTTSDDDDSASFLMLNLVALEIIEFVIDAVDLALPINPPT